MEEEAAVKEMREVSVSVLVEERRQCCLLKDARGECGYGAVERKH